MSIQEIPHFVRDDERSVRDDERSVRDDERSVRDDERSVRDDERSVRDDERSVRDDERSVRDDERSVRDDERSVRDDERSVWRVGLSCHFSSKLSMVICLSHLFLMVIRLYLLVQLSNHVLIQVFSLHHVKPFPPNHVDVSNL